MHCITSIFLKRKKAAFAKDQNLCLSKTNYANYTEIFVYQSYKVKSLDTAEQCCSWLDQYSYSYSIFWKLLSSIWMWWYEYYDRLYWIHIAYSGYTQCICGWGRKQTNQCLGTHEVHWNVSKFSKKILSEPVAINLWERFSTTRLIVLRLSWMKDSMSFTDAVQKNSRASSGKSQSDDQQSPNYSWNCSFTMGHLYLEQLSSSRGACPGFTVLDLPRVPQQPC